MKVSLAGLKKRLAGISISTLIVCTAILWLRPGAASASYMDTKTPPGEAAIKLAATPTKEPDFVPSIPPDNQIQTLFYRKERLLQLI